MKLLLTLMISLSPTVMAHAQPALPVRSGERVRVVAPALPEPLVGDVTRVDAVAGTFVVSTRRGDAQVTLPLSAVQRLDVSRGRARERRAALLGAAGLLVGGAIGAREGSSGDANPGGATAAVVFGATGATFGALLGYAYAPERWDTVHRGSASAAPITVAVSNAAKVKRLGNGLVAVQGEPDRRRGVLRGALVLGSIAAVFGGIDAAQGELKVAEYLGVVAGNVLVGGAAGYLIAPRDSQRLPAAGGPAARRAVDPVGVPLGDPRNRTSVTLVLDISGAGAGRGFRSTPIVLGVMVRR